MGLRLGFSVGSLRVAFADPSSGPTTRAYWFGLVTFDMPNPKVQAESEVY